MGNYSDYRNVIFNKDNNEIEQTGTKFICDGLIAQTIAELRKKGYETSECCAGHSNELFVESYEREETLEPGKTIKDFVFDNYMQGNHIQITEINGNKIRFNYLFNSARTYIFFPHGYAFSEDIPDGFEMVRSDESKWVCIQKWYRVINDQGAYKTPRELDREIKEANDKLLRWAKSLQHKNATERLQVM